MRYLLTALFVMAPVVCAYADVLVYKEYVPYPPSTVTTGRTPNVLMQRGISHHGGFHDGYRGDKKFK